MIASLIFQDSSAHVILTPQTEAEKLALGALGARHDQVTVDRSFYNLGSNMLSDIMGGEQCFAIRIDYGRRPKEEE